MTFKVLILQAASRLYQATFTCLTNNFLSIGRIVSSSGKGNLELIKYVNIFLRQNVIEYIKADYLTVKTAIKGYYVNKNEKMSVFEGYFYQKTDWHEKCRKKLRIFYKD